MAKRPARRGRSRKRRRSPASPDPAAGSGVADTAEAAPAAPARPRGRDAGAAPGPRSRQADPDHRVPGSFGPPPRAPWHPVPLAELLILLGMVGTLVGVTQGESGRPVLFAGIAAAAIGTIEFTLREHLSGYRSHATMLAAIPTALVHAAVGVGVYEIGAPAPSWAVIPLVLDVPLFAFLFKVLRARFLDARRERVFHAGR